VVLGFVYGMGACRERRARRGGGVAAPREDKEGWLGFTGLPRLVLKRRGRNHAPGMLGAGRGHAERVLGWRRG
jgi:hypothetical protein